MDRREPCPKLTTLQRNPDLNRSNECDNAQSAPASAVFPGFLESPDHFCFSGFSMQFRFACRSFSSMNILVFWRLRRLVSFPE